MIKTPLTKTFDELLLAGWSLDSVLADAYRVEFSHFGSGAFTEAEFRRMYTMPGSLCALLFPPDRIAEPGYALGIEACVERRSQDGIVAHQLVTIAIDPAMTGQGLGLELDNYCEALIVERGYKLRILRSRAPSYIYAQYGGRIGGSPHAEATRFALKRGFSPMSSEQSLNFFGSDIARLIVDDVIVGDRILQQCVFAESLEHENKPPWYFICMSKEH